MKPASTVQKTSEMFVGAVEKVLRQILKLILGRLSFPKFVDLARKVFVEEAEKQIRRETGKRNIPLTELGLLTGIDTRSLSKVRDSADYDKPISESETFFAELTPEVTVVDVWRTHPEFIDSHSADPLELAVFGKGSTFESLVQMCVKSRGITVQSILNRLQKSESVSVSDDGQKVKLNKSIWMHYPKMDVEDAFRSGLTSVSRHLDTVVKNIQSMENDCESRFERLFWTTRLDPEKADEFKQQMAELLKEASENAAERIAPYDKDHSLAKRYTAGVGFYYFDSMDY